jgi:acyl dehydratase/NADP-dependent 3-hydroxy acid dehydrogenase YdfG
MMARTFHIGDQRMFASLSGDFNPMHVDEHAARRLLFGKPVVHGIHAVLWALDEWCRSLGHQVTLRKLRADFQRPLLVGTVVECEFRPGSHYDAEIVLRSGGTSVLRLRLDYTTAVRFPLSQGVRTSLPPSTECAVLEEASLEGLSDSVGLFLSEHEFSQLFPRLLAFLPQAQLATLLATTRIIGMECPGRHSLYSSVSLEFDPLVQADAPAGLLRYRVESLDGRFHLAIIGVEGLGVSGSLRAFVRPAPREQLRYEAARAMLDATAFRDRRALIVGGSRGLGEVAAKLLAAGGAAVTITYHRGADDAERVASEIRQGGGSARIRELNVLTSSDTLKPLLDKGEGPTDLLYFATPLIAPGDERAFSADLFNHYCSYYVQAFTRLVENLAPYGLKRVFYPSSVYVEDPPARFAEYAAAKAAGETVCMALQKGYTGLMISKPRLPRVATDQTASLTQQDAVDPAPLILEALTA